MRALTGANIRRDRKKVSKNAIAIASNTPPAAVRQPPAIPERFVRLAFIAYQKGRLSHAKLSEMLDTSLIDLPEVLQEYGLTDQEGFDAEMRAA